MTAKERVRSAVAREEVDMVPLGFYAVDSDTVERVIGRKTFVRDKIGLKLALAEGRRAEVAESLKQDTVEFFRKIDCADLILPKEAQRLPPADYEPESLTSIDEQTWEDQHHRIWRAVRDKNDMMCIHDPTERTDFFAEEFQSVPQPTQPDDSEFEVLDHLVEELGDERYICSALPITALTMLSSFAESLMIYALQPEVIHAANRQLVIQQNATDRSVVRDGTSGIFMEQDMAGSNAPWISPEMFRDLCLPYMKERVGHVKKFRDQVVFHNCGMNIPLMDMFAEAGIDCYQSLQTTAGMEVGMLKERFGDRIAFWGGVPVESLIAGTPDDVRQAVRTAMERGAPGGGFILGPSHSIAFGTKYDNFMAMIDEYMCLRDRY